MSWQKWYPVFLEEMEKVIKEAPKVSPVHKNDHVLRVWEKSKILCERLGADMEVMIASVIFHDLGRHHVQGDHGDKSAEMAKPILERIGFPVDKIDAALEVMRQHDHSLPPEQRKSLEAKILYDTDKMDAFGVIGVYRHILFIEAGRMKIEDVIAECKKRWDGLMLDESRDVAREDYEYIVNFFKTLVKKLEG